jgi:hypothetical protein
MGGMPEFAVINCKRRFLGFARLSSEMHLGVTALAGYFLSKYLARRLAEETLAVAPCQ